MTKKCGAATLSLHGDRDLLTLIHSPTLLIRGYKFKAFPKSGARPLAHLVSHVRLDMLSESLDLFRLFHHVERQDVFIRLIDRIFQFGRQLQQTCGVLFQLFLACTFSSLCIFFICSRVPGNVVGPGCGPELRVGDAFGIGGSPIGDGLQDWPDTVTTKRNEQKKS